MALAQRTTVAGLYASFLGSVQVRPSIGGNNCLCADTFRNPLGKLAEWDG